MYELPHELPNNLRLGSQEIRKLQEYLKITKKFDGKYLVNHPKAKL